MSSSTESGLGRDPQQAAVPDYEISAEQADRTVRITFNGVEIAESDRAILYRESRLSPVYYFPREDVRLDLMRPTQHRTHCPFKGNASYWTLNVDGREVEYAGDELLGRVLQHEVDHINGTLLLDRLPKRVRKQALKELRNEALGL